MPRTARPRQPTAVGLSAIAARVVSQLSIEPGAGRMSALVVALAAALYAVGIDYPLVFGDFAAFAPGRLEEYARGAPVLGTAWLADASFGWWSKLFGSQWQWHRALNLGLHAAAICFAFGWFRRVCMLTRPSGAGAIANGWIAFLAAALFALHPAAVYAVAYLSARSALLVGLFGLIALWSTARALQQGWRGAWFIGPLACAAALACGAGAVAVPLAMALSVIMLRPGAAGAAAIRTAWGSVAIGALIALVYVIVIVIWVPASPETMQATGYPDALAAACTRLLRYLGYWLVPVTAWMAVDIPEQAISIANLWPGWLAICAVVLLAIALGVASRAAALLRCAAIGVGCALALYCAELVWPRLGAPLALARSYAWMPCASLALACLIAALPLRAAFAGGCIVVLCWALLAAGILQSFSSHIALWDAAVRRAERTGPRPEDARVYLNRATLHRHEGHLPAAVHDYDTALALQPDQPRALRGRAQAYIDDKRYGEALRDLDRLLELDPAQAITHADRGLALMQAGRIAEAGRAFDTAIERGVKEPRVFLNRGLARLQLGGLGAAPFALADVEKALALDPDYALAYYNRALIFEQAAKAGMRLRDAVSPELMRVVAAQNFSRACKLGLQDACARERAAQDKLPGGNDGPIRVTPESLRRQGLPAVR